MESTKYELIQLNSGDFVALPVLTCPLPRLASIGLRKERGQTHPWSLICMLSIPNPTTKDAESTTQWEIALVVGGHNLRGL